jgi:hypothetical protein
VGSSPPPLPPSPSHCRNLTDACLVHLKGVRVLKMSDNPGFTGLGFGAFRVPAGRTAAAGTRLTLEKLNVSNCFGLKDQAFNFLEGLHTLHMDGCTQLNLGRVFAHLDGVKVLSISECDQETKGHGAFAHAFEHLKGIEVLHMSGCHQASIHDEGLAHLAGIRKLFMNHCSGLKLSAKGFRALSGILELDLIGSGQELLEAAHAALGEGVVHPPLSHATTHATSTATSLQFLPKATNPTLSGGGASSGGGAALHPPVTRDGRPDFGLPIKGDLAVWRERYRLAGYEVPASANLDHRFDLKDADLEALAGIQQVSLSYCTGITDAGFAKLAGVLVLDASHTNLGDAGLRALTSVGKLYANGCQRITDAGIAAIGKGLHTLHAEHLNKLTEAALGHLKGCKTVWLSYTTQAWTDNALALLKNVQVLDVTGCRNAVFTDAGFAHLKSLHKLYMSNTCFSITPAAFTKALPDSAQLLVLDMVNAVTRNPAAGDNHRSGNGPELLAAALSRGYKVQPKTKGLLLAGATLQPNCKHTCECQQQQQLPNAPGTLVSYCAPLLPPHP